MTKKVAVEPATWFVDFNEGSMLIGPFQSPEAAKSWAEEKDLMSYRLGTLTTPERLKDRIFLC